MSDDPLASRLRAAGIEPGAEPVAAWRALFAFEGPRATVLDLYALVARARGVTVDDLPVTERHALARTVMPDVWAGFEQTPDSERGTDPVVLVDPDPDWPAQYARWATAIRTALGPVAVRVEHVGSTAVPGLAAKPTVDVQVSVADLADESSYVPALAAAGLQLRSRDDLHRFFRPFPGQPRAVHVHVCAVGSRWEADHLLFRDHLRAHPGARAAYEAVKRDAARRWADDRWAYTDAKTAVILSIMDEAREALG